jgi:hypothetical protein
MVAALGKQLTAMNARMDAAEQQVTGLRKEVAQLSADKSKLQQQVAELQQYSRRNNLRIINDDWVEPEEPVGPVEPRKKQRENTDALVLELAAKMGIALQPTDISRSHRVGKREDGKVRPIIVAFTSYNARQRMMAGRKNLRTNSLLKEVYINEELTGENNRLARQARKLRAEGRIAETFTRDGRVYAKRFAKEIPVVIRDIEQLNKLARMPGYSEVLRQDARPDTADDSTLSQPLIPPGGELGAHALTSTPMVGAQVPRHAAPMEQGAVSMYNALSDTTYF